MRAGMMSVKLDGLLVAGQRRFWLPHLPESQSAIEVGFRMDGLDGNRLFDQLHGSLRVARLQGDHAQQMQRFDVSGLYGKDLLVGGLRRRQASSPMVLERLLPLLRQSR